MSKSIQDYRNIVKILKLQLLKVRQENSTLSHQIGIVSESETSSFTPKLNRYRQSDELFAKKVVLFLEFAHRCELVGIYPEMVFRIADKKRDKSVKQENLKETIKRIKLRMSEEDINTFVSILSRIGRGDQIMYEDYLECLSAFQVNSQKYPPESSRTYMQLCLIKFCKLCKQKYPQTRQLFKEIAQSKKVLKYSSFVDFCAKQFRTELKETEIVAVFLGLDLQSLCQIQDQIFEREIGKFYNLVEKGITEELPKSSNRPKSYQKKRQDIPDGEQYQVDEQEGDQGFAKATKKAKKPTAKSNVKLDKKGYKVIEDLLRKQSLSCIDLMKQLFEVQKELNQQKTRTLLRAFTLEDFHNALKKAKSQINKKVSMQIFRSLDKNGGGSVSTEQIVKMLIRSDEQELMAKPQYLYTFLYRHLKQIQFPDPLLKFTNLGFKPNKPVTQEHLQAVFDRLNLQPQEFEFIYPILVKDANMTIQNFCQLLKKPPSEKKGKKFQKIDQKDYQTLTKLLAQINKKRSGPKTSNYKKMIRKQDLRENQTSQSWDTIFQNQWDCFKYCLETAHKLTNFWRDHQFGPTKGDVHGLRSIIGNESTRPKCFPEYQDQQINWISYEEMLSAKGLPTDVQFMPQNLKSTDVVQGAIGDCWYISALSIITLNDQYFKGKSFDEIKKIPELATYGIYPKLFQYFSKFGMYVFKFFKKFKPVYVIVDELFPAKDNQLMFAKSPEDKLKWVSFAQKAYAKLHHSYTNMISGDIAQGLNDLTNSLPIKEIILKEFCQQNTQKIKALSEKRQLMGCSIKKQKSGDKSVKQPPVKFNDQFCGLVAGHAYSIIDYLDLKTKQEDFKLIRVRNPWGKTQWVLDWSDHPLNDNQEYKKAKKYEKELADHYQQKIKKANKQNLQAPVPYKAGEQRQEDGQFLMNFADWNQMFNNLFIGISQNHNVAQNCQAIFQTWDEKVPSGMCKQKNATKQTEQMWVQNNHQYILEIKKETQICMLLIQQDGRLFKGETYPYKQIVRPCLIFVFPLNSKQDSLTRYQKDRILYPKALKPIEVRRDISCWATFKQGRYAIFPCKLDSEQTKIQFQFRVYSDKKVNIKKIGNKTSNTFKQVNELTSSIDKKVSGQLVEFLIKKQDINKKG